MYSNVKRSLAHVVAQKQEKSAREIAEIEELRLPIGIFRERGLS
jgi:hypothetical protein